MSKSDRYGHIDRRIPTKAAVPVRVQKVIDNVYNEFDGLTLSKDCTDPDSYYVVESEAFRKAVRKLDLEDRKVIEALIERMSLLCGKNFGERSAEQVLAKLGIWFKIVGFGKRS